MWLTDSAIRTQTLCPDCGGRGSPWAGGDHLHGTLAPAGSAPPCSGEKYRGQQAGFAPRLNREESARMDLEIATEMNLIRPK